MGCPLMGQVPVVVWDVDYGQPWSLVRNALCKAQAGAHNLLNRKVAAGMSVDSPVVMLMVSEAIDWT